MKLCEQCRKEYNEYHKNYAQKNKEKRAEANRKYYLKKKGRLPELSTPTIDNRI